MYKKCENCYKDGKTPNEESCKKCENDLKRKEQELNKAKQIILQAVDDFSLEYGTPYYDKLLESAKSLGIEVKDYE